MGEAKNWKKRLFKNHPICCFCGGTAPATQIDHQPGRVFFRDRQWPEGFVFPACSNCNAASRLAEDAVSLLTSNFNDEKNRQDFLKRRDSIRNNHPELIRSLAMTTREKRGAAKRLGFPSVPGQSFAELPLARLDPQLWIPHLRLIGKKLALAFHYQALLRPMPHGSKILLTFSTNAELIQEHDLTEFLESAPQLVMPMRNREMLGRQFALRWGASTELGASMFVVNIQQRLVITALNLENTSIVDDDLDQDWIETPFEWSPG